MAIVGFAVIAGRGTIIRVRLRNPKMTVVLASSLNRFGALMRMMIGVHLLNCLMRMDVSHAMAAVR